MKLDFLELENIRTYPKARIDFQTGVTLFEGDVGCGKSTLLYAIEFALFGLGDLKAGHLLSHGASSGSVKLGFEVGGKPFVIFRQLERKKDAARQSPGWIQEEGVRADYSAEELKKKILVILGFRENPAAKATSWIFRYAVFTPQEEMKEILNLRPEERLQTLRKAFGVEEYRTAAENTQVLQQRLREKARELKGQIMDVPALEARAKDLNEKRATLSEEKNRLQAEVEKTAKDSAHAEVELNSSRETALSVEREAAEVPLLKKRMEEFAGQKERLDSDGNSLRAHLDRLTRDEKNLREKLQAGLSDPTREWEMAEKSCRELQRALGAAEHAAREHQALRSGTCPTCGQKISEGLNGKIQLAERTLADVSQKLQKALQDERASREKVRAFQEQKLFLQKLEQLRSSLSENQARLADAVSKKAELSRFFEEAARTFEEKKHHLDLLSETRQFLLLSEQRFRRAQAVFQAAQLALTQAQTQSDHLEEALRETHDALAQKKRLGEKLADFEEKERWLSEHFISSLARIEEHVLYRINHEFNRLFSRWFVNLLETQDLEAEVDPSFTPKIRQGGFEQDFTALSGGEKSALALAYRLSLNTLVRQTTPSLRENLLILDEPTDGFSKEQLSRMRSVLQEAKAQQVLLVSHERELEAFCDQVFLVEKNHGVSRVKAL